MATFLAAIAVPVLLIVLGSVLTPRSTKPPPAPNTTAAALASSKTRRRRRLRVAWLHAKRATGRCLVSTASGVARLARLLTPAWVVVFARQIVRRVHPRSLVLAPDEPVALPEAHEPRIALRYVVLDKKLRSKPIIITVYPGGKSEGRLKIGARPNRYVTLGELPTSPTMEAEFFERAKQKLAETSRDASAS
jgi:hypothetical protein